MVLILIYIVFITGFFGNLLSEYGIIPREATLVSEASVYLLFCFALIQKGRRHSRASFDLGYLYAALLVLAILSAFLNGYLLNLRIIVGLRFIFRFYIFYLALINLDLTERQQRKVNTLLFAMFILQLPASGIRFMSQGISEETIGTYATHGGGLTPIIPIVALGYLAGFYTFQKPRVICLLMGIGFILFGIAGAKRALFFMYPLAFLGIYYLSYIKAKRSSAIKSVWILVVVIMVIISVQLIMMKNIATLNPERTADGSGSINYSHVFEYAREYETQTMTSGRAGGRISTTILAIKTLIDADIGQTFFGFGPGSTTSSALDNAFGQKGHFDKRIWEFSTSYGKTGMTYSLIEYGPIGALLLGSVFLIFISRSLKWFQMEYYPYWKALSMGTVIFSFLLAFIFFFYNTSPVTGETILPVFFYAMSLMFYRISKLKREAFSKTNLSPLGNNQFSMDLAHL